MKLLALFCMLVSFSAMAQPGIKVNKADSCYKRADAGKGKRFAEWQCGKIAGVVDCNEKLEMASDNKTIVTASAKEPFTGTCETCHRNGVLERRVIFVNGQTNGSDTTYYPSGCIMVIRNHVMGAENGRWTYFYDSIARPNWEMNYVVGQKDGPQVYYTKKGDTTKYEQYKNGVLSGPKLSFDPKTGKRTKQANYVNGLLDGPFLVYNPDGKIIQETNYRQGKKNGIFKYYYDDGVLLKTESWNMDVQNGEFKTFYYEGNIQTVENYRKGAKEGVFEEYFPDQKLKRRALYKKNVLVQEQVYNEQGKEISRFGTEEKSGAEDDAVPAAGKKKKPKKAKKTIPPEPAVEQE